jgi:hypothetical protein
VSSGGYLVNGRQESRFICLGWLIVAAYLTRELQGGCPNLGVIGRRVEIEEGFDIATDDAPPVRERLAGSQAALLPNRLATYCQRL